MQNLFGSESNYNNNRASLGSSVVPHPVSTTFDFSQMALEALNRSSYVSDFDELSELSELSESDSYKEDSSSQSAYRTPKQTQDNGTTTQENKNLLSRAVKRKARNKEASKRNKKKKKTQARSEHQLREDPQLANNHGRNAQPVASSYKAETFNISARGYIGKGNHGDDRAYWLHEMVGEDSIFKFELKKWDASFSMPLLDKDRRILAFCLGFPHGDETWHDVSRQAAESLDRAGQRLHANQKKNRRGNFLPLSVGISYGGGQTHPKILQQDPRNKSVLEDIMKEPAFARLSGFTSGAFSTWAPRLYRHENECLESLINEDKRLRVNGTHPHPSEEELRRNWPTTPWACATFNCGPQTVCLKHADYANLAFGWCAITSLGEFDYEKGGHMILWDLGLVVEFPPGSTIMIPSSVIHHSNTRIQSNERRYSFTQYSAGGLFRWVDLGFKKVNDYMRDMEPKEAAEMGQKLSQQLEFGLSLYSTYDELIG